MPDDEVIHRGQWFHPLLNPPAFEELARVVSDVTDLQIRRRNHRVGNQFHDVSSKLEIARFHTRSGLDRIAFARENLAPMLDDLAADLEVDVRQHRRVVAANRMVIEFRDHVLVAHLEGLLIQVKCLLDSLSQFYSLAFGRSVKTFSDKGENVVKDLANLGAAYGDEAAQMTTLVKAAKSTWADEAIRYRDELVHFGQLRDFRCLHLPLTKATRYLPTEVHDSVMPNMRRTEDYFDHLLRHAHEFAAAWLTIVFARLQTDSPAGSTPPRIGA
jgi:hypothetical protein